MHKAQRSEIVLEAYVMVLHTLYSAKPGVFACVSDFCEPLTRKPSGTSDACASESLRTLGRFAAQNSLSGLHFSPEQALGYSATLRWLVGAPAAYGLALRPPLRGRACSFLMSPSQEAGRHQRPAPTGPRSGSAWPRSRTLFETRMPAP